MTTTWTEQKKYEGQIPIKYNEPSKEYNETGYTYNGVLGTKWNNETKN